MIDYLSHILLHCFSYCLMTHSIDLEQEHFGYIFIAHEFLYNDLTLDDFNFEVERKGCSCFYKFLYFFHLDLLGPIRSFTVMQIRPITGFYYLFKFLSHFAACSSQLVNSVLKRTLWKMDIVHKRFQFHQLLYPHFLLIRVLIPQRI